MTESSPAQRPNNTSVLLSLSPPFFALTPLSKVPLPIQEAAGHDKPIRPFGSCPCEKRGGFAQCTGPDGGNVGPVRSDVYNVLDGQSMTVCGGKGDQGVGPS